ncbi:TlpA disulfide reductase family protein [Pedobacter sp. B4-66]|uniref:TlpA family protein disulfide reductase n=1 Tax=Pedobacter sp. B4-66 TaxID=2817280 RepID=UPI001BD920E3|nr:TlpA disulfide reductase family protein [Pedobacter sp. B4-66]
MKTTYKLLLITIMMAIGLLASFCFANEGGKDRWDIAKEQATITITVEYNEAKPTDTLSLLLENVIYRDNRYNLGVYAKNGINKRFRFVIPVNDNCGYWKIIKPNKGTIADNGGKGSVVALTKSFFWEAGDDIFLSFSNKETFAGVFSTYSFSGKGAEKYVVQGKIYALQTDPVEKPIFDSLFNYSDPGRNVINVKLKALEGFKGEMSALSYDVIKADIIAQSLCNEISGPIKSYFDEYLKTAPDSTKQRFLIAYRRQLAGKDFQGISVEGLSESGRYFKYLHDRLRQESYFKFGTIDMEWIFSALLKEGNTKARDRAVVYLFGSNKRSENVELLYSKSKELINDKYCLLALNRLMGIGAGSKFESFTLTDTSGKLIDLSMFKGKVIFIDFWSEGCGACINFFENALSKVEQEFESNNDIVFISVSIDRKKQKWLEGVSSGKFTSKDVVNLYTSGMGADHPIFLKNRIVATPHTILVDKWGSIKYNNTQNLYEKEGLIKAIKELL